MIKVLYVCPWAHWAGHAPQSIRQECFALIKAGAQVTLCTFRDFPDQQYIQSISHRSVISGWITFPLDIVSRFLHRVLPGRGLAWFLEQFMTLYLAVRLKKTVGYDIIYLRDGDPFVFIPFVLGLFLKKYVWAIKLLGVNPVRSPDSLYYKFANSSIWKPIYRRGFYRNRFVFICENEDMKKHFEDDFLGGILSGTVRVIPQGVEMVSNHISQVEARSHLGLPHNIPIFLHFGAVHSGKDIVVLLDAIKDVPDTLLVNAGKVALSINLKRLVQGKGLQSRVKIIDRYITEAEKPYYFAAADAVILSYKKDFLQTASMLFEAAKFKLPTIASDVGELGALVKNYRTGFVFTAEDPDSLKDALSRFLCLSQSDKETMGKNCEKLCDDFSLETWGQRYMELLTDLCRRESGEL